MTRDGSPPLPERPTLHARQVVELADEYRVTSAQMLAICDRLGVEANDAASWLGAPDVRHIRAVVAVAGPEAVLGQRARARSLTRRRAPNPPELGSVQADGVRTRRAVVIALCIIVAAVTAGVLITTWLGDRTSSRKAIAPRQSPAALVSTIDYFTATPGTHR